MYDATLVSALLEKSVRMPPLKRHAVNNAIVRYMAYSGYYGVPEVVELEKAKEIEQQLRLWLEKCGDVA